ncbi:MAG: hypothetical protein GX661_03775, partial [Acholeplasmataceae bacterium]|nr:hypothetical protein [Acholeplasmataceae bacterium]
MIGSNLEILEKQAELATLKEVLLLISKQHEDLNKECVVIYHQYNFVFGECFYQRYQLYYECERLRRQIELYQYYLNREEKVNRQEVEQILLKEFLEYEQKLSKIFSEYQAAVEYNQSPFLSAEDIKEIKRIYIKIAKAIHPDLNPDFDEAKKDLWLKTLNAYKDNNLPVLQECEFLFDNYVHHEIEEETELDALSEKIASFRKKIEDYQDRINLICNTFPYNQKELLENKVLIAEKINEVEQDIELFRERL